jgi:2-dehydropantoate 2-reductase
MSNPPWHILGFGVIGQLLHAGFRRSGQQCVVIPKANALLSERHAVRYQDHTETFDINAFVPNGALIERLVVCTKSYDVIDAIKAIKHSLSPKVQIVTMINGLVGAQEIANCTSGSVYWALTTEGGYRTEAFTTVHGGSGITRLGSGLEPDWLQDWQRAIANSHWHNNIEPFRWEKLCVNAVINPLTALNQCRNGELANAEYKTRTQTSIDEAGAILGALGFKEQADRFNQTCWEVIHKTGTNRSSMLQDVSQNRRTELSTILPPLLSAASAHGILTPQLKSTLRAFTLRFPDLC